MHSFLRAIGFSEIKTGKEMKELLSDVFHNYTDRIVVKEELNTAFIEYSKSFGTDMGIKMCGNLDGQGFHQEYYFPYFSCDNISSYEDLVVEKHGAQESFAGVCEDVRMGVSIIFFLQNIAKYKQEIILNRLVSKKISTSFTGLAISGKILLPVLKKEDQNMSGIEAASKRGKMISAAREGDTDAIESLTLEDIDTYTSISRRIQREDLYSIIDTMFMPYGLECDQYQVIGNILDVKMVENTFTKEHVYQMSLECNDVNISVCVNEKDLLGYPDKGMRFKGNVWLQGRIDFPIQ